jgi:putative salt-induced outer membrane protein YdiY
MNRRIFSGLVLVLLAGSSRAADTNQTAALAFLATVGSPVITLQPAGAMATNKPAWESSVSAGFTLTKGNSDTLLTTAAFRTRRRTPENEFMFGVDGAYGESDSVKNNEFLRGASQYNHLFNERIYGFLNAQGLHDGIADLQYRFALSPGAGYNFVRTTNTTFAGELGPGLITQRLGGVDTTYGSLRLAERFEYKPNNGARVWQRAEILPQVDKWDNFLVNAEIGAEALFAKSFSLRFTVLDNFVNQPAPGRQKNDVKLISGVVYRF